MVNINWEQAQAYCKWARGDLPTEAEWEKAARGTDGCIYPWGNDWDGNKCANSVSPHKQSSTIPVGSYPQGASPYGVLDMAGNVWEWCSDFYSSSYYGKAPARNPVNNYSSSRRVLRGGSWLDVLDPKWFRAAYRYSYIPDSWSGGRGFRCAWNTT